MNPVFLPKYAVSLVVIGLLVGYLAGSVGFPSAGDSPANTRNSGYNATALSEQRIATATESEFASATSDDIIRRLRDAVSGNAEPGAAGDGNGYIKNGDSASKAATSQPVKDDLPGTVNVSPSDLDAVRKPAISAITAVSEERTAIKRLTIAQSAVDATDKDDSMSAETVASAESPARNPGTQGITPTGKTSGLTIHVQNQVADPKRTDVEVFEAESPCGDSFVLVTTPRLGFSNEETTYLLGQPMFDLIRAYGLAEKVRDTFTGINTKFFTAEEYPRAYAADTKTYVYVRKGILVTSDNRGLITGALFYVSNGWAGVPANIFTRFGGASGASLEEIMKAYGQPAATRHHDPLGYYDRSIDYAFGGDILTFNFWQDKLISIGITHDSSYS